MARGVLQSVMGPIGRSERALTVVNSEATTEFWKPPRLQTNALTDPYRAHAWVFACMEAITGSISRVPMRIKKGTREKSVPVETGPWVELFKRPNPLVTPTNFWKLSVHHLLHPGECAWVLEGKDDRPIGPTEVPTEIWPLSGKFFEPIVDREGSLNVLSWKFTDPKSGRMNFFEPHQLIMFRHTDPMNLLRGLSKIQAAMSAVRQDVKAATFNEAFFEHGAVPGGVLMSTKGVSPSTRKEIKDAWESRHQGSTKAHRVALLEGGLTYQSTQLSHTEMAFIEQRKWSREEVMAVFHVPKFVLALYEDLNFATAREAITFYWEETLDPEMTLIEETMGAELFRIRAPGIFGEFDRASVRALQKTLTQKIADGKELQAMGYPINMVNEELGLGMPMLPPEFGDQPLVPASLIPADQVFLGASPPASETSAPPPPPPPPESEEDEEDSEERVRIWTGEKVVALLTRQRPKAKALQSKFLRKHFAPLEAKFRRATVGYLKDLRDAELKALRNLEIPSGRIARFDLAERILETRQGGNIEDSLFDLNEWKKKIVTAHDPAYQEIIDSTLNLTKEDFGGFSGLDGQDPIMQRIIDKREVKLQDAVETIRESTRKAIAKGLQNNESMSEIAERVKRQFNGFSTGKSLTIARTEVGGVTNETRFEAMDAEGVEKHEWVTANDEAVRDSHEAINGDVVEIGQEFDNGLKFPGDPSGPPEEVINCFLPGSLVSGDFIAGSKAFYSGPAWEIKTVRGKRLCVTPNHPILTDQGWIPAHELNESHRLFTSSVQVQSRMKRDINHQDSPALVEDVFNALAANAAPRSAVISALDFHGDSIWMRDVQIVNAARKFKSSVDISSNFSDILSDSADASRIGLGALNLLRERLLTSTNSLPSGGALALDSGAVALDESPFQFLSIGPAAYRDLPLAHESKKSRAAMPAFIRQLLETGSGLIAPDQIISVRKFDFTGHVYDLQSKTGMIIANGICSSNCRCLTLAVL